MIGATSQKWASVRAEGIEGGGRTQGRHLHPASLILHGPSYCKHIFCMAPQVIFLWQNTKSGRSNDGFRCQINPSSAVRRENLCVEPCELATIPELLYGDLKIQQSERSTL